MSTSGDGESMAMTPPKRQGKRSNRRSMLCIADGNDSVGAPAPPPADAHDGGHGGHDAHAHAHGHDAEPGLTHECWFELFYDLIFVSIVFRIGDRLKYSYGWGGGTSEHRDRLIENMWCIIVQFMLAWILWLELERFMTRYHKADVFHLVFYLLQAVSVTCFALNIENFDHANNHDDPEGSRRRLLGAAAGGPPPVDFGSSGIVRSAQATALCFNRFTLLAMHVVQQKYYTQEPFNRRDMVQIVGYTISLLFFFIVGVVPSDALDGHAVLAIFFTAVVVETVAFCVATLAFPGFVDRSEAHEEHTADRLGVFVMLTLGEAVLQLVISTDAPENEWHLYVIAAFYGLLAFNIAVLHFDTSSTSKSSPSHMPEQKLSRVVWTYMHLPLTWGVLVTGVAVKGFFYVITQCAETDDDGGKECARRRMLLAAAGEYTADACPDVDECAVTRRLLGVEDAAYCPPPPPAYRHLLGAGEEDCAPPPAGYRHLLGTGYGCGDGAGYDTQTGPCDIEYEDDWHQALCTGVGVVLAVMTFMKFLQRPPMENMKGARLTGLIARFSLSIFCHFVPYMRGWLGSTDKNEALAAFEQLLPMTVITGILVGMDIRRAVITGLRQTYSKDGQHKQAHAAAAAPAEEIEEGGGKLQKANEMVEWSSNPASRDGDSELNPLAGNPPAI